MHLERLGHDVEVIGPWRRRAAGFEVTRHRHNARQFVALVEESPTAFHRTPWLGSKAVVTTGSPQSSA